MAKQKNKIAIFEGSKIRRIWDDQKEVWYFVVMDIIEALVQTERPRKYWNDLKAKLKAEGSEVSEKIGQLKMQASDGKFYLTDCGDTETILRIIQSIPSPKAEPFKQWLAKVGNERIEETQDPELAFDRAMKTYLQKGYSKEWINQRLKTIEVRKELTDEWERVGIKDNSEFAILTNEITEAWSGHTVKDYKKIKSLKKENLRDNMNNVELVLNMLAEVTTKEISKKENPKLFSESREIARKGGTIVGNTRKEIEQQIGKPVITSENNLGKILTENKPLKIKPTQKLMRCPNDLRQHT